MNLDVFKLTVDNKFIEITSARKKIDEKIFYNLEHLKDRIAFETHLFESWRDNSDVLELYSNMMMWLQKHHPELLL